MSIILTTTRRPRVSRIIHLTFFVTLFGICAVNSYETQYENWEGELASSNHTVVCNPTLIPPCYFTDAPASKEEFDHDNSPDVCGLPILTVEEWEAGRYWKGKKPVIVKNVTDGWAALEHWKKYVTFDLHAYMEF